MSAIPMRHALSSVDHNLGEVSYSLTKIDRNLDRIADAIQVLALPIALPTAGAVWLVRRLGGAR